MSGAVGPLLIGLAAVLWATDTLFRLPATGALDATGIVLYEHLIGLLAIAPVAFARRADLKRMSGREWASAAFVGAGGSAFSTVLFTASFAFINPSVTILLQKLQPIFAALIAFVALKEKPDRSFFLWAGLALLCGIAISFPDFDFSFLSRGLDVRSKGVLYALGAAFGWALSTVVGKSMLRKVAPFTATFWRFAFGLGTLAILALAMGARVSPEPILANQRIALGLLYMGLVPGVLAMQIYYAGLGRTPASVATFVELIFPVAAVSFNAYFLDQPLTAIQAAAAVALLFSISKIGGKVAG